MFTSEKAKSESACYIMKHYTEDPNSFLPGSTQFRNLTRRCYEVKKVVDLKVRDKFSHMNMNKVLNKPSVVKLPDRTFELIYDPTASKELVQRFTDKFQDTCYPDVKDTFLSKCGMKCKVCFMFKFIQYFIN